LIFNTLLAGIASLGRCCDRPGRKRNYRVQAIVAAGQLHDDQDRLLVVRAAAAAARRNSGTVAPSETIADAPELSSKKSRRFDLMVHYLAGIPK